MSQLAVPGWNELLLARSEFTLINAYVTDDDERVADVELPRDDQPCPAVA